MTDFIAEQAFAPLIVSSQGQFGVAVTMSFTIAMFVLGLSYMIAHFIRLQVVDLRSALVWYALVGLFFQLGPELYLGLNGLRADINSFFYAGSLQTISASGSPLAPLSNNLANDGTPMLPPCDNFGWLGGSTTPQAGQGVDGLDIAMAYLLATSRDVLGQPPPTLGNCTTANPGTYPPDLPFEWYHTDGYFDRTVSPPTWDFIPADDRERALDMAAAAQYRLIGAWPLLTLGLFEKIVFLLVTLAQGLSFVTFAAAAIFAFFKRTEPIARSVVDLWIEIIITSVVIALAQSLIVSLALAAAATQNPLASIGVGLLCSALMAILVLSAAKLVWNSLTRIFGAVSQATGGAVMTPQEAIIGATVGGVSAAAAVATGGGALALTGAAMVGMGAAGIGGPASSMAGSQLMMAGRMARTSGARRMNAPSARPQTATFSAPAAPPPEPIQPPPSVAISAYDPRAGSPNSIAGARTARIGAQFTALENDSRRDESVAQARLNADNVRDDAAMRDALTEQRLDTSGLERAGRELSAVAQTMQANARQAQMDRVMGHMDVAGPYQVGSVVADAVDMEREYRAGAGHPMLAGAGETFSGRMAQAVGVQPGDNPITDAARFNAVGDQALRLGLNGGAIMQVVQEQAAAPDGRSVQPDTRARLVETVQSNTGARASEAEGRVGQFLNLTAAMPTEVRITGSIDRSRLDD